jgi:hypothetical protein
MRLCLGMMIHGEYEFLRRHLPVYANACDGFVGVVESKEECFETANISGSLRMPGSILVRDFHNNWSEMFNHVIAVAEQQGYDAILRMDPDEAMFDYEVDALRDLLETYSVLCFPRYNFWGDAQHYTPGIYPDWQARAWRLHKGIRLGGQHHEGVGWMDYNLHEGDPIGDAPREVIRVPHLPIYHYGNVGRERMLERDLHYVNVERERAGHPPLSELPPGREFPRRHSIPFHGPQPVGLEE